MRRRPARTPTASGVATGATTPRVGAHRRAPGARRAAAVVAGAVCAVAVMASAMSAAVWTTASDNTGNQISSLVIAPPTGAAAAMQVNVLPLLTCRVTVTWTASTTPGVTGYEVVRVLLSNGSVVAGPWTVAGAPYLDNPVPLQLLGNSYAWRVRSVYGSWRSAWATATATNQLACLL